MTIPGDNSVRRGGSQKSSRTRLSESDGDGSNGESSRSVTGTTRRDQVDISSAAKQLNAEQGGDVVPIELPSDSVRGGITAEDAVNNQSQSGQDASDSVSILREVPDVVEANVESAGSESEVADTGQQTEVSTPAPAVGETFAGGATQGTMVSTRA